MITIKIIRSTTAVRQNLTSLLDELEDEIIVTKNYRPRARITPLREDGDSRPALILLGTKSKSIKNSRETIRNINEYSDLFSRVIFVCSEQTRNLAAKIQNNDLRIICSDRQDQPIISPLKAGLSGLNPGDDFLIFTFLSTPRAAERFPRLIEGIKTAREKNKLLVIPRINGDPAHPVAVSTTIKDEIINTRKELGIPHLIKKFEENIHYHEITVNDN
ncbi:MAG: hypothetical protein ACQEP7_06220 [bacterium]